MNNINKKLLITTLSATIGLNVLAHEYKIMPTENIDLAVELIQKSKIKSEKKKHGASKRLGDVTTKSYTPMPIGNFSYDAVRDTISTIYDNANNPILYIVHNKNQNDPTLTADDLSRINASELQKTTGYTCDSFGITPHNCGAMNFYTRLVWGSNSVGAKINL